MSNSPVRPFLAAVVLLAVGCASAPVAKPIDLTHADALVLEGCYDCLIEARGLYDRAAVGLMRPSVIDRLFETELLLILREKELALDSSSALARARAVAAELPPALEAERYLTIVDAVPGDSIGWPRRETEGFRRARVPFVPRIDGELTWLETAALRQPFRQYVALAIDCASPTRGPGGPGAGGPLRLSGPPVQGQGGAAAPAWPRTVGADAPPLLLYRRSICGGPTAPPLERTRSAVPRFIETSLFLGRLAASLETTKAAPRTTPSGERKVTARALVDEAYDRFPASPAVTYLAGNFNQLRGDCRAALRYYDETIALKPVHEDALLGRTMCLTFLKRFDEAIVTATRMIDLATDNVMQAYYWRAWIRHEQQQFAPARLDIEQAKVRGSSAEVHTLAGIIEYDQDDLGIAQRDLQTAKVLSSGNCVAMWYLGLVAVKGQHWLDSGSHFNDSTGCYGAAVMQDQKGLQAIQARDDLDPDFKTSQIAGFEAAIKEDQSRQYTAALNAANEYAQGGDVAKAKALLEIAARDPSLADKVDQLRKIIGR